MMPNFAAPNMSAVGNIGGLAAWDVGQLPLTFNTGNPFTLQAWVQAGPNAHNALFITKPGEFSLGVMGGVITAGWGAAASTVTGVTVLEPGVWHFASVTYDGTTLSVYLDGAPEGTLAYSGPGNPPTTSNFFIGAVEVANDPYDIWNATFYNYARTEKQEADAPWIDLVAETGLIANFDFSIAPAHETIASYPLTPINGAVSQTLAPAIGFDGMQSGILVGPQPAVPAPPQFSVSAWVALNSTTVTQMVFASGDPANTVAAFTLGFGTGDKGLQLFATAFGIGLDMPVSINIGDWHNIAMTADGSTLSLYLDGQLLGQTPANSQAGGQSPSPWTIGFGIIEGVKQDWFSGQIQWLTAWSRCLSATDIAFQQYGSVSDDPAVMVDISLDAWPPTDISNGTAIQLAGTAGATVQRTTVTAWVPPPEQLNPTSSERAAGPRRLASVNWPTPVSAASLVRPDLAADAYVGAAMAEAEVHLKRLTPDTAAVLRDRYERQTRDAGASALAVRPVASWRREGAELVFTHHHPQEGDIELLRVPAEAITACQTWWLTFLFTLIFGVLNLFFIAVKGKEITDWVQKKILGDQSIMTAFAAAWQASPSFTGFTVIKLLSVIYNAGLMRSLLWYVAYKAGYYGVFKLFAYLCATFITGGATAVLFAGNAAVLAVQLSLQVFGGPNVPSYSASCSSQK